MNGITPTNFLADYIDVWDYKHWSEDFLNLIKVEVDGLKEEIKTAYQFFETANNELIKGKECTQVTINNRQFQRIINLVTKYDNQSVIIDIFKYIVSKLEYGNHLNYERNCNSSNNAPTDDFLSRKARIYQNLFSSFSKADSLEDTILTSGHDQNSFEWFFSELMPGTNGSLDFANEQGFENKTTFRNEVIKLAELSNKQKFRVDSINQFFGQEGNLILAEKNSEIEDGLRIIIRMEITDNLDFLIAKRGKDYKIIGAQKNEKGYLILWEQSSYKNLAIRFFKTVSDSSFVIGGASWIKHISYSGQTKNTIRLKSSHAIIHTSYNELRGSYWVIQANDNTYTLTTIGSNGKVISSKPLKLQGEFMNMWSHEGKYGFSPPEERTKKRLLLRLFWKLQPMNLQKRLNMNSLIHCQI